MGTIAPRADRFTKRCLYQEFGVPCYWVVDVEGRVVETWTPGASLPRSGAERLVWTSPGVAEPLVIPVLKILPPA